MVLLNRSISASMFADTYKSVQEIFTFLGLTIIGKSKAHATIQKN